MRYILFVFSFVFFIPQTAQAQFDLWGAAEKIFTATKPILTEGNTATSSAKTSSSAPTIAHKALGSLSNRDIENGLRQALELSAVRVTDQLGSANGFYDDPKIKIPLPNQLQTAHDMLSKIGLESLGNDLELKMNTAAELAMPKAKALFLSSIEKMTLRDAQDILMGPDNAATAFFQKSMGGDLITAISPIIDGKLSQVRGMQTYNQLVQQYGNIPFAPKIETDLTSYVSQMAVDGIFTYMAQEEAAIRANPVERSTALLQKVFSAYQ